MGIFCLETPFSGVRGKGGFSTPKPCFPDFGDFDPCKGRTGSAKSGAHDSFFPLAGWSDLQCHVEGSTERDDLVVAAWIEPPQMWVCGPKCRTAAWRAFPPPCTLGPLPHTGLGCPLPQHRNEPRGRRRGRLGPDLGCQKPWAPFITGDSP